MEATVEQVKIQALEDVIERVDAGRTVSAIMATNAFGELASRHFLSAYRNKSLDTCMDMVSQCLPGWSFEMTMRPWGMQPALWHCTISDDHTGWGNGNYGRGNNIHMERAILIAAARALKSKIE